MNVVDYKVQYFPLKYIRMGIKQKDLGAGTALKYIYTVSFHQCNSINP